MSNDQYEAALTVWRIGLETIHASIRKSAKRGGPTDHLVVRLAEHHSKKPMKPLRPKLRYSDTTPEAMMAGLFENWPSACLHSDEAGILFDGRATGDLPKLNSLYSGGKIAVDRRTSDSFTLENVRLSISAMIQPAALEKFIKRKGEEARGSGFWARFLICQPQSSQGERQEFFIKEFEWPNVDKFTLRMREILDENFQTMKKGEGQEI